MRWAKVIGALVVVICGLEILVRVLELMSLVCR